MIKSEQILKVSLLAGALYFLAIALAHVTGFKLPGLFIFYNVPSYQYQDTIIAFLAFGWAVLFYIGAQHLLLVRYVLVAALVALIGLSHITAGTDFSALDGPFSATPFWVQIALLALYVGWLLIFWWRSQQAERTGAVKAH